MDIQILVQSTPNPNALKFVVNHPVKSEGKVTYKTLDDCEHNPLAASIFSVSNIVEVYFFDNYITVTQDGNVDWDDMEEQVRRLILEGMETHNPSFKVDEAQKQAAAPQSDDPEITKINEILDRTIRPALQMDGGDLAILGLKDNILLIAYQGACGSCPSATMGTLHAIENILRDEYHEDMIVELA